MNGTIEVKNLYFTRDKETEITFFNYQLGTAAEAAQELLIELEHLFDIGDKEKIQIYERFRENICGETTRCSIGRVWKN